MDPEIHYGKDYQIVATRDVQAGEQLQNSYNKCKWCDGLYENAKYPEQYYVTPQLFEVYGFTESWPQRWIVPEARLLFDVIEKHEGEKVDGVSTDGLQVNFVAPPSSDGLDYLHDRLEALKDFDRKYRNSTSIPRQEYEGLFNLHDAMSRAFSLAVEQSIGQISNRVWYLGEDWHKDKHHRLNHDEL